MFDYAERYGHRFVKLTDSRATKKVFDFGLGHRHLTPSARSRREL